MNIQLYHLLVESNYPCVCVLACMCVRFRDSATSILNLDLCYKY